MFLYSLIEIFIAILIIGLFVNKKKPQLKYLFYGFLFFFFMLIIQIPIKFLGYYTRGYLKSNILIPIVLLIILSSIISEVGKYLSLKKFLKTKKINNAILFVIGWVSFESINLFSIYFFKLIFGLFNIDLNYSIFLNHYDLLNFIFFYIFNLALSVLVIISVIKRKTIYLFYAISLSVLIGISMVSFVNLNKILIMSFMFLYSIFIIFKYNQLK